MRTTLSILVSCTWLSLATVLTACSSDDASAADRPVPTTTGATATLPSGDGSSGSGGAHADAGTDAGTDLAGIQKRKAQMLTSLWENDTTVFQYAFSRNNGDGYGYTSGRVGFTTATGDAYYVVKCFDAAFTGAGNLMKKYEPALAALEKKKNDSGQIQGDTSTLDASGDFTADWKTTANLAATAPAFHACQDDRVDQNYWAPTLPFMTKWGLGSALARASVYDATIVHGEANVNELATQANADTGNGAQKPPSAPLSQAAESAWLEAFHAHRVALLNSSGAWRGAIARGANYEQQRRNGNFDFSKAIVTDANANAVFPGQGYSPNSYQACVINADGSVSGEAQCTAPVSD